MEYEEADLFGVKNPSHYNQGDIECIDAIRAMLGKQGFAAYCQGSVIKYLWRYRLKNGIEDLRKANVFKAWLDETVEEIERSK